MMTVFSTKLPAGLGWPLVSVFPLLVIPHWFRKISKLAVIVPEPAARWTQLASE
jgi:hypothetical protein